MTNTWFPTASGIKFDLAAPTVDMIELGDIALALGKLCRFNGHCREFYSVAEHSFHVARLVDEDLRVHGLLHDAHEAYVGDFIAPLKSHLGSADIDALTERLDGLIYEKCGIDPPDADMKAAVKHADLTMLATERRDLFPDLTIPDEWIVDREKIEPSDLVSVWGWGCGAAAANWLRALTFELERRVR